MTTSAPRDHPGSNRAKGKRWHSCFISASPLADPTTLKTLLEQRGIRVVSSSEPPATGASLLEHVTTAISSCDLFIAVLQEGALNAQRYLEIGIAHALRKRVLVLASPGLANLPSHVGDMLYIRAHADNREAIDFALDQTLAAPSRRKRKPREPVDKGRPLGQAAEELRAQLERLGDNASHEDLENLVVSALEQSAIPVIARSREARTGADLAIWVDELEPWVSNPILIEIKPKLNSVEHATELRELGSSYLKASNASLLVVLHASPLRWDLELHRLQGPEVVFLEARDLFDQLRDHSFAEILRELRNRWARGGGF